uniref:Putative receptor-like protein kinase RLPK1 n=1 Tax=Populus alba TaxID=43335 RepID=A0A4U5QJ60_POPAL|nr:putative receptor-like protein kinase RLPK1 [Populus alba]
MLKEAIFACSEFDLSYNNFTEITTPTNCKETLKPVECLSDYCSKDQYSVHINCGGSETTVGNTIYEADDEPGGATKYVPKREVWQISITGHVWEVEPSEDDYIAQNMSILRMNNSQLYTKARLTPLSLTYHVRCLVNGNYNVKLHFAEIVMRDNRSFYSLGRRIFDVYIQDRIVLKDFDIEKAAQGVDKVYIHNSTAKVIDTALEIRLHWAGKGTTTSPKIGIYGPLISPIDIESEFKPPTKGKRKKLIVAGSVVLLLFLVFILLSVLWWKGYLGGRKSRDQELVGLDLALSLQQNGDIMELVDPRLGSAFKKKEAARMIKVALLCTIQSPALRPTMSAIVRMLEGKGDVQELVVDPSTFGDSLRFKSFRGNSQSFQGNSDQSSVLSIDETRSLVRSSDRTWDGPSSSSAQDLYPDH